MVPDYGSKGQSASAGRQRPQEGGLDDYARSVQSALEKRGLQVDLGAERLLAAQKGAEKIAVEIKSFVGANDLDDLYHAIGQFILYRKALRRADPDRELFLAIDGSIYKQIFDDPEGESLRAEEKIKLLVFDKGTEEIVLWKR